MWITKSWYHNTPLNSGIKNLKRAPITALLDVDELLRCEASALGVQISRCLALEPFWVFNFCTEILQGKMNPNYRLVKRMPGEITYSIENLIA